MFPIHLNTPITLLYAGLLALFYVVLVKQVVRKRHEHRVARDDGGQDDLAGRIRAHANFAEYVPFLLLFLLLAELNHLPSVFLHIFGISLVGARLYHAYGLIIAEMATPKTYRPRFLATFITVTLLVFCGVLSLIASLGFLLG